MLNTFAGDFLVLTLLSVIPALPARAVLGSLVGVLAYAFRARRLETGAAIYGVVFEASPARWRAGS